MVGRVSRSLFGIQNCRLDRIVAESPGENREDLEWAKKKGCLEQGKCEKRERSRYPTHLITVVNQDWDFFLQFQ